MNRLIIAVLALNGADFSGTSVLKNVILDRAAIKTIEYGWLTPYQQGDLGYTPPTSAGADAHYKSTALSFVHQTADPGNGAIECVKIVYQEVGQTKTYFASGTHANAATALAVTTPLATLTPKSPYTSVG